MNHQINLINSVRKYFHFPSDNKQNTAAEEYNYRRKKIYIGGKKKERKKERKRRTMRYLVLSGQEEGAAKALRSNCWCVRGAQPTPALRAPVVAVVSREIVE